MIADHLGRSIDGPAPIAALEYPSAAPAATVPRRPWIDLPLLVALLAVVAVIVGMMLVLVPRFENMFKNFGIELPTSCKLLLAFSRFIRFDFGWAYIVPFAFALPIAWARIRRWPPRLNRRRGVGALILAVVMIGASVMIVDAILMDTTVALMNALTGNPNPP